MKKILFRLFVSIFVLGSVTAKPAKSEAKTSDMNEPGVNKHFDFSNFLGNIFGGQPGGQNFYPNTGNVQMNGQQQQYPNQNPNQNQQNNQNQWQNGPSGNNNFGYPNQGINGAFNNGIPWQNSGTQQYPNNPDSGQNNNQGRGQEQNSSSNTNNLDWKNLYPSLTLNQPPSQNNNNPQTQNPQFNQQWPNQGSNQFQYPGNSPGQSVQTPYVNPTNPQQWQNSVQGPINAGQNQNPSDNPNSPQQWQNSGQGQNAGQNQNPNVNENMPEDGTIDSLIPGEGLTEGNIPPSQASSTSTTDMTPTLCQQNCPSTGEYNPVCGNNNVTYNNPGSLLCARNCGLTVRLKHRGRCSGDPANRFMG